MRLSNIAHLYLMRLRARSVLVQESFAVLGIAVGTALLFASQIASTSLNGSVQQLMSGVVGNATYQVKARSPQGFSDSLVGSVRAIPGVSAAVPVLEEPAYLSGPGGHAAVDMIATDPRFVRRSVGPLLRHFKARVLAAQHAIAVPAPIARSVGVRSLETIEIEVDGRVTTSLLASQLSEASIGPLAHSPVILAPLAYAQSLAGVPGKVTRIFVHVRPGHEAAVHAALVRLAAGRLNVEPANYDATLFAQAAAPVNQSTSTFAMICALVGFMFAYCSMLLSVELRRGLVRELRRGGATRWVTVKTLLFDALVVGVMASAAGLALGDLLSILAFGAKPGYLAFAFPVGSQRIVTWQSAVISVAVAMLAATAGVLAPLREVWSRSTGTSRGGWRAIPSRWTLASLIGAGACVAGTSVILLAAPQSAILGVVLLLVALLLVLPTLTDAATMAFGAVQRRLGAAASEVAIAELRSPANRARSLAIAATGAIAVFGCVVIQASHVNLEGGLSRLVRQLSSAADVWVLAPGQQNTLATTPFSAASEAKIAALPGVRAVGRYRAGFLEVAGRRVWVLAPPAGAPSPIPRSQLLEGDLAQASAEVRRGGWAVLSQALAQRLRLHLGQSFTLPSANPIVLRLAGTSTNLGWPPGAVIIGSSDFARAWGSGAPTAFDVMLAHGFSPDRVAGEIRSALGHGSGLTVQTGRQRIDGQLQVSSQGLSRLTQIAVLVLLAGILATVSAMGAAIWQRRRRFAAMKVHGLSTAALWGALVWESGLLLGAGCVAGAAFGVYGQVLLSHALLAVTGFPVIISLAIPLALGSFLLVTAVAAAMIGLPGYRVASVAPYPHS